MPNDPQTFSYGGDEVDVSVWNTERAFQSADSSKKRKHNELFSGEVWRAKNASGLQLGVHSLIIFAQVPHNNLQLRQPVRITAISHVSPTNILAGTQLGSLKRYDIRAARKPVSDWEKVFTGNTVTTVETGFSDQSVNALRTCLLLLTSL